MNDLELPSLGGFLRALRKRPTAAAPTGLTRQQLATAVHTSVGYIAKIEQGDAVSPSTGVLDALSAALELGADDRVHLYRLAGHQMPSPTHDPTTNPAPQRTIDALAPHPVVVVNDLFDILAWNSAFEPVFPGARASGNILRWIFTDPYARLVLEEWEHEAGSAAGTLRHYAAHPRDPRALRILVEELIEQPDFRRLWSSGRITVRRSDPTVRLRNPCTGAVHSVILQQLRSVDSDPAPRILVGLLTDVAAAQ
ncbi:helix-turn-helix transcriptional regulator [Nocardia nova]|uniref:helix-turn-helix transcriptional regulator n=1 Tax=Nocardia nova TaxID=37330 RepID=UPI000AB598C8|nr:helix-turn-helix transcriptional regulator [Nocardia nova]